MHRRLSVVLLVLALSGALLGVQNLAGRKVLSDNFAELEREEGDRSIQQVLKALEADLNQLAISTHDYAAWDDAYEYAHARDARFVTSNFAIETLANMNVDVVWLVDTADRDIVALERHADQSSGMPGVLTEPMQGALRGQLPMLWAQSRKAPMSRLLRTSRGLLAFASNPIVPTGGRGDARGLLVFGRFLDVAAIERAQNTSQLPVDLRVSRVEREALPREAQSLWLSRAGSSDRLLVALDDSTLAGYALIRDVNDEPAAIVGTRIERKLRAFGRATEGALMMLFAAVIGVFAVIVCLLLYYMEKAGQERMKSQSRYQAVITQAQETMLLVDARSRRILEANPAATTTLGYSVEELEKMYIDDLFYACDDDVLKAVRPELPAVAPKDRILIVCCNNKRFIDVEVTASPLTLDDREVVSFVLRDVSARKKAERQLVHNQERLTHLAHHDALTGLLNRLGLERRLPAVIEAAARDGCSVAFLYLDIDHFKKINDLRGHPCGDRLLQICAGRLRKCLAADDLIVRMGGDEFVVVAAELRNASDAAVIAARVREKLAEPFEIESDHFNVTSSVGVSVYPQDGAEYEVLLKNADIALYESKDAGRDTFTLFAAGMVRQVSERLALEHDLKGAIRDGQFYLEYQPLVDLATSRIASLEALVRWHHPIRGRVPPMEFIDIAEKAGLITEIGEFVMRQACRQIREWQQGGAVVVPVAVNVSTRQFERQNIIQLVRSATEAVGIEPKLLRVELTESAFMDGHERHVCLLRELRELGVEVSVDDFGTGYSSLAYLKHLPIDCLKIDRAFVRDMGVGGGDAIVEAIIRMATSLGLTTVAEGVETPVQARRLQELGATYGQGFYFSRPVAADVCGRLLLPSKSADPGDAEETASLDETQRRAIG